MGLHEDLWEATHNLCDKCGRPVPANNSMPFLMSLIPVPGFDLLPSLWYQRHVLPVVDEAGTVLCEGSPSRAQYLPGQPRDTRGYEYNEHLEPYFRTAWDRLQELCACGQLGAFLENNE